MSIQQTNMPIGFRLFIVAIVSMAAFCAWNIFSPYGSEARLAAAQSRLGSKCVENAAGDRGVVQAVEKNGDVLVVFEGGIRERFSETRLSGIPCSGG